MGRVIETFRKPKTVESLFKAIELFLGDTLGVRVDDVRVEPWGGSLVAAIKWGDVDVVVIGDPQDCPHAYKSEDERRLIREWRLAGRPEVVFQADEPAPKAKPRRARKAGS